MWNYTYFYQFEISIILIAIQKNFLASILKQGSVAAW